MEIGPVSGIRVVPVKRIVPAVEAELPAVFDMEKLARPADDAWTADGDKPPGGQDDADNDLPSEDNEPTFAPRQVNFFA